MVTDGLVLYVDAANVKSYPRSGTVWTDLSQTTITGSLTNGPTFNTTVNGSIFFDGSNDFVDLGNTSLNISAGSSVTLSAWVNIGLFQSYAAVISRTSNNSPFGGWQLNVNNDDGIRKFDFAVNINGVWRTWVTLGGTFPVQPSTGVWYNMVGTYNGASLSMYQNGTLISSQTSVGSLAYASNLNNLHIGRNQSNNRYLSGSIAIVSVYNRALSTDEVLQNYEAVRERFGL
jgi:hypothetical protein